MTTNYVNVLLPKRLYDIKYGVLTINSVIDEFYDDPKHTFDIELKDIRKVYTDGYRIDFLMKNDDFYKVYYEVTDNITYVSVETTTIQNEIDRLMEDKMYDY